MLFTWIHYNLAVFQRLQVCQIKLITQHSLRILHIIIKKNFIHPTVYLGRPFQIRHSKQPNRILFGTINRICRRVFSIIFFGRPLQFESLLYRCGIISRRNKQFIISRVTADTRSRSIQVIPHSKISIISCSQISQRIGKCRYRRTCLRFCYLLRRCYRAKQSQNQG